MNSGSRSSSKDRPAGGSRTSYGFTRSPMLYPQQESKLDEGVLNDGYEGSYAESPAPLNLDELDLDDVDVDEEEGTFPTSFICLK